MNYYSENTLQLYRDVYDTMESCFDVCPKEKRHGHICYDDFVKRCEDSDSSEYLTSVIDHSMLWMAAIGSFCKVVETHERIDGSVITFHIPKDCDRDVFWPTLIDAILDIPMEYKYEVVSKTAMAIRKLNTLMAC